MKILLLVGLFLCLKSEAQLKFFMAKSETNLNLFPYDSEVFDNFTVWQSHSQVSVTANAAIAPDGQTTAEKEIPSTTNTSSHDLGGTMLQVTNGVQYTLSIYLKAAGRNFLRFSAYNTSYATTYEEVTFNLANGSIRNNLNGSGAIVSAANGYYRCSITFTAIETTTASPIFLFVEDETTNKAAYSGNGTDGILLWGIQQNTGATATTYQKK